MGCINQIKWMQKNIQKLFDSYMEKGEIPLKYRRDYKSQQDNHHQSNSIMLRVIPWWIYMRLDKYIN
jgi:hypothetical protein